MTWKESRKSLLEWTEDLRTETAKLPLDYPQGTARETYIRDKILSQVKNTLTITNSFLKLGGPQPLRGRQDIHGSVFVFALFSR